MRRPDPLLAATVLLQWLVTAGVAVAADHSGSVYGGSAAAERVVGAADAVAHGGLPPTTGPGYSILLAPIVRLTDDVGTVTSIVTTVNMIALTPLAAWCLLEVAERAAGRLYAAAAAIVWILAPVAAVPLFTATYRPTYVDGVLPALYGLTLRPEFTAMALSIAAAAFALRASAGAKRAGIVAGTLAGAAAVVTPTAAAVGVGAALALAAARRWQALLETAVALAAALVSLVVWRERALGGPTLTLGQPTWSAFQGTMAQVREHFWSNRLLQWLAIAGAAGALRLARPLGALAIGWFGAYALVAVATPTDFSGGHFFVSLIPSWPAYALLVAAVPALVPTLTDRLRPRLAPRSDATVVGAAYGALAVVLLTVVPLLAVNLVGR